MPCLFAVSCYFFIFPEYAFSTTAMTIKNVTKDDAGMYRYNAQTSGVNGESAFRMIQFSVYGKNCLHCTCTLCVN